MAVENFMAFGSQDITDMKYKKLQKIRKLAGTDYALKGEIAISTINKDENIIVVSGAVPGRKGTLVEVYGS